ncbi:MAG: sigma-54-dependent Fis family transcriptional regulator [Deltaproteobacteria bacterium]|mgnify:CR=1 FL=1|nr:sigma-54-dependent Fis family transcriptional regulator [Deltaproteobacteria bacterium]MBW1922550.1 sigma-54-dependent Fis family transcriptional regulator [Deltaproteobacteria bacterium]MBW1948407.1 sigma-54-dependent Fis family transcriptional regulator [Deltaproteobacteria bacterium]MBW2007084.1 sigma-54-dependent Fis family transcriptional regulator [Deltaproteobacteria bacterium]MBW2101351.1 sigma-54-dependent Fis family transcriptional regulator [Deltaproteobacteria bacterium]
MQTARPVILLVDDERKFIESMRERMQLKGFPTYTAVSGEEALEIAERIDIDLAIVDQRMPGMDGLTTISKLKQMLPGLRTVLLTGYGNDKVREAAHAADALYFEKDEMRRFWEFIRRFGAEAGMIIISPPSVGSVEPDPRPMSGPDQDPGESAWEIQERRIKKLIGESFPFLELKQNIKKVAPLDCPVLIHGETGTGKELLARAIHALSPRGENRFVAVNCGTFQEDLLNNELFGHEREAFTTVLHRKVGVFEAASGGTVLLSDIAKAPPSIQVRILRLLQDGTVVRVGGAEEIPVDVRILAACEQEPRQVLEEGTLRKDLYYALNAVTLKIPPLRERPDDVPLLARYFLDKYRRDFGKAVDRISGEVLDLFMSYTFPCNVAELENAIEHAVILCEGKELRPEHLPRNIRADLLNRGPGAEDFPTLAELEKRHILRVLKATGDNKSEAARILGINRASLWRKLKQMNQN